MRKKKLSDVVADVKDDANKEQQEKIDEQKPPDAKPDSADAPVSVRGRYAQKQRTEMLDKKTIRGMLQTPFLVARMSTGFDGFKIPELAIDELTESGYRVYLDFGFDGYSKWFNVVTFGTQYFGILGGCIALYLADKKKQMPKPKDEKPKDEKPKDDKPEPVKEPEPVK